MFKKSLILASTILAFFSTEAFAVGPYVGISGGADDSAWHTSHNFSIASPEGFGLIETFSTSSSSDRGAHGFVGTVFGGYGALVCSNIYLAGEIFGNIVSTSANAQSSFSDNDPIAGNSSFSVSNQLRTKYGYGISFIPGVLFNNSTMGYARIGLIRTRFNHSISISGIDPDGTSFAASSSGYNNINGGQLGLGLQTNLCQNWDLRGEYTYTAYQSYSSMGERIIPRNNQVSIGIVGKFC